MWCTLHTFVFKIPGAYHKNKLRSEFSQSFCKLDRFKAEKKYCNCKTMQLTTLFIGEQIEYYQIESTNSNHNLSQALGCKHFWSLLSPLRFWHTHSQPIPG
jgi:hypothetical protein